MSYMNIAFPLILHILHLLDDGLPGQLYIFILHHSSGTETFELSALPEISQPKQNELENATNLKSAESRLF